MTSHRRIEVYSRYAEGNIKIGRSYLIEGEDGLSDELARKVFSDSLSEVCVFSSEEAHQTIGDGLGVQVFYRPGVTDNVGRTAAHALNLFGIRCRASAGTIYYTSSKWGEAQEFLEYIRKRYANDLTEQTALLDDKRFSNISFPSVQIDHAQEVCVFDLDRPFEELFQMAKERHLAFSRSELRAVSDHFRQQEGRRPSDVELEIIAQTWSEHCKHKIFSEDIEYREHDGPPKKIGGLFKSYIERATGEVRKNLKEDFLVSVFKDNAGIVRFDKNIDLCFKVRPTIPLRPLTPMGGP